jgi:hypothetical protein
MPVSGEYCKASSAEEKGDVAFGANTTRGFRAAHGAKRSKRGTDPLLRVAPCAARTYALDKLGRISETLVLAVGVGYRR